VSGLTTGIVKFIATFGGLGYIPKGPGTFGALGALIIAFGIHYIVDNDYLFQIILFSLIVSSYISGVYSARYLEKEWGHDASRIVIDEAMGMWVSMLLIPFSWVSWSAAFIFFRFFDILKPLGIRKLDNLHSSHGVMLDDLLAGIYSNISVIVILEIM
jgi:phosphatidylglycerophosphatase A